MHWIIQSNLFHETGLNDLLMALDRMCLEHTIVQVVPFSHELIPDCAPIGDVIVLGSTSLCAVAMARNWSPGSFLNDNHDFRVWSRHYDGHLLNDDFEIARLGDVNPAYPEFFIRPCNDDKLFAGTVMTRTVFAEWRYRLVDLKGSYTSVDLNTMVMFATPKAILQEIRFFVIDGRIVTGSVYKRGSRVIYSPTIDSAATAFAQARVDHWAPARGFVLDIALTDSGYKVIEINCLNSAGFYASNVGKIVEAIEQMA